MGRIGSFMAVDRVFLFRFNWDRSRFHISHLWEAEGIDRDGSDVSVGFDGITSVIPVPVPAVSSLSPAGNGPKGGSVDLEG